jgi:hypothetical protein
MIVAGGSVLVAACSGGQQVVAGDASDAAQPNFGCGNGAADPCCYGTGTPDCIAETACLADGGTWMYGTASDGGVVVVCSPLLETPLDASVDDSPADVAADSSIDVRTPFCCNANYDPCCLYQYCGGPLTAECSAEIACKADGGTYDPSSLWQPDGSSTPIGCSFPGPDAAPTGDAGGNDQ